MLKVEFGLNTFGDLTVDGDGRPLSYARVLRDVVAEALSRFRKHASLIASGRCDEEQSRHRAG